MDNDYLAAILFFLPAGIANMAPVFANKLPYLKNWNTPIDLGKSWRGKRIFGDHKTWRGLVVGTITAGFTAVVIAKLVPNTIGPASPFVVGLLLGFGALAGDAIESFFKRQKNIASGNSWFPFDQIDYILGGLLAVSLAVPLQTWVIATVLVAYFGGHLLISYLGYKVGLKDKPI